MTQERDRMDRQGWLEALRPDPVTRARLRAAVLERAGPLLAKRREEGWLSVAAGWSGRLAPVAAAAALFFGWLAYDAGQHRAEPAAGVRAGALAEPGAEAPPELLTSGDAPSADRVLAAALQRRGAR